MPYQLPREYPLPYDCTKCIHFKKPRLYMDERVRYLCHKYIYMPKWSINYMSCEYTLCPHFEPTPESGIIISPQEKSEVQEFYKRKALVKFAQDRWYHSEEGDKVRQARVDKYNNEQKALAKARKEAREKKNAEAKKKNSTGRKSV